MKDVFLPFKNIHEGRTAVLCGSGPSLAEWRKKYEPDALYFGCNSVAFFGPPLDYFFIADNLKIQKAENGYFKRKKDYDSYFPRKAKFYGTTIDGVHQPYLLSSSDAIDGKAMEYGMRRSKKISFDLSQEPVDNFSSIFVCLQLAVWCGCNRIIIVGCDITNNVRIGEKELWMGYKHVRLIERWRFAKAQLLKRFPNIQIKVFEPLGLKSVFEQISYKK